MLTPHDIVIDYLASWKSQVVPSSTNMNHRQANTSSKFHFCIFVDFKHQILPLLQSIPVPAHFVSFFLVQPTNNVQVCFGKIALLVQNFWKCNITFSPGTTVQGFRYNESIEGLFIRDQCMPGSLGYGCLHHETQPWDSQGLNSLRLQTFSQQT